MRRSSAVRSTVSCCSESARLVHGLAFRANVAQLLPSSLCGDPSPARRSPLAWCTILWAALCLVAGRGQRQRPRSGAAAETAGAADAVPQPGLGFHREVAAGWRRRRRSVSPHISDSLSSPGTRRQQLQSQGQPACCLFHARRVDRHDSLGAAALQRKCMTAYAAGQHNSLFAGLRCITPTLLLGVAKKAMVSRDPPCTVIGASLE